MKQKQQRMKPAKSINVILDGNARATWWKIRMTFKHFPFCVDSYGFTRKEDAELRGNWYR